MFLESLLSEKNRKKKHKQKKIKKGTKNLVKILK